MPYVELHCHSHYSLLDGASSPSALLDRAAELGYTTLALTDHDGLYGAIAFYLAARECGIKPIIGAEVTLEDDSHLVLLARNRQGYGNLCGLLSEAGLAGSKGNPRLSWEMLPARARGLIALSGCERGGLARLLLADRPSDARELAGRCRDIFEPGMYYVELQRHRLPDDARRNYQLVDLAQHLRLPIVATHNVHYATQRRHRLHDVLTATAQHATLDQARLRANSEYYLRPPADMKAIFHELPEAIRATEEIAEKCEIDLDLSSERLPDFPVPPGETAFSYLHQLCQKGLQRKYRPVTPRAVYQLQHELQIIQEAGLAGYFLIVWDIVRFAREQRILARGRGSAANSIVAYVLDITAVDPLAHNLLFERFLTPDSRTMPDIDIDFAADRREEVIQYVYRTYGQERTGMVATTITYHARSAVRDVAKALGFPLDVVDRVAKMVPVAGDVPRAVERLAGDAAYSGPWRLLTELAQEIEGTPRHLGIHAGGMILTGTPLAELVPLERATMPGRVVVQWDKYSAEDAGLIKFDLLGLRALTVLDEVVRTLRSRGIDIDLDSLPLDDPAIYDILRRGDTVGAFQVESRAQAQMLPNLAPTRFEDIVVGVALIRPGPLQGNMVHPYLRRRRNEEAVTYFHPSLEPVLEETLGVILFQEQVLRVAMTIAGFSGAEADGLRRAMSRNRSPDEMERWQARFVSGAVQFGLLESEASEIFGKLAAFAGYGFCKSHAAAFAQTAYHTLYLRHYYPAEYYCGLLNARPGYWGPDVIVGDARRHGVRVRPVDVNLSRAKCRVEEDGAIRLGWEYVHGLGEAALERLEAARAEGPFRSLNDVYRRARLNRDQAGCLIRAGALDRLGQSRRQLLWELARLRQAGGEFELEIPEGRASFPELTLQERVAADYELLGLPAHEHVMVLFRRALAAEGICPSTDLLSCRNGERVRVAGVVVIRQQPPTAKGFVFLTLEDEDGLLNVIVRPDVFERHRDLIKTADFLLVDGVVESEFGVVNVMANRLRPLRADHLVAEPVQP